MKSKKRIGYFALLITGLASIVFLVLSGPMPQDTSYHLFSDIRNLMGIQNFWNVVTNLPFLFIGLLGLLNHKKIVAFKMAYLTLFAGILCIGIGSGYYHYEPDSESLVLDRLPMTIVFMALFSIVISEFISYKVGKALFVPLLMLGILSIVYWIVINDLRLYGLVQFYPMIAIPIILLFFGSELTNTSAYWKLFLAYIVAKVFEYFDPQVWEFGNLLSGHSIKHIFAAIGLYILVKSYINRDTTSKNEII